MNTVIAYVPALHSGYIDFFKKYPGTLYLLDLTLVREIPRLERDIRAMSAQEIKASLESLGIYKDIKILTKENINKLDGIEHITMPYEDVSEIFATTYLPQKKIEYVKTFLRWNNHNAQQKNAPDIIDRIVSQDEFDREIMGKAIIESEKSPDWWRQIGALAVRDKKILFTAHNRPLPSEQVHNIFGDPRSNFDYGVSFELSKFIHAEAQIIAEAAKRGISLDGASMYVTTYPCPVCAKSIAVAGIKKVYFQEGYALLDAEDILKSVGAEIIQVK
ncbi:hypothetical protein H0W32_00355 [Patescibacteria group bacterium]|nr:hypothetical protein [Patescibacteria group bacterium]